MTEITFKVGDVVVLDTSRPNSMNDLRTISSLYENGKCAVTTDGRKIRLLCGDFKVHIHATPAEIAAGHRIDEPSNGIEQRSISTQLSYPEIPDSSKCPHPPFERGLCDDDGKQPCLRCGAEVESGKVYEQAKAFINRGARLTSHQIDLDTPPNATISPTRHDLPKDGAMVQDGEKEAVASSRSEFERAFQNSLTYQHLEQANYFQKAIFAFNDATGKYIHYVVQAAYEMWQHQQAVVTTLTEALDIKEQLNQKLREREEELQKRVDELTGRNYAKEFEYYASLSLSERKVYDRAHEWKAINQAEIANAKELQKRVGDALALISKHKKNEYCKAYCLDEIKQALGADHESN